MADDHVFLCLDVFSFQFAKEILRYLGIPDEEDDGESFEEKMARLTCELSKCFEESNRLQAEIRKNLEAIGYGL